MPSSSSPLHLLSKLRTILDKLNTFLNILLQVDQASVKQLLLRNRDFTNRVDYLDAIWTKLNLGGKEVDALIFVKRAVDIRRLDDARDALGSLEQALSETRAGHGHGQGSGAGTALCLHDLITAELHALDQLVELGAVDGRAVRLRDEGDDSHAGVAADYDDVLVSGIGTFDARDEARGADDVESGYAEQALRIVHALGLEDLSNNRDGGVDLARVSELTTGDFIGSLTHRVRYDEDVSVRGSIGASFSQVADDRCVRIE